MTTLTSLKDSCEALVSFFDGSSDEELLKIYSEYYNEYDETLAKYGDLCAVVLVLIMDTFSKRNPESFKEFDAWFESTKEKTPEEIKQKFTECMSKKSK